MRTHLNSRPQQADSSGIDVTAVPVAALDDLGVAGDNLHARCRCRGGHGFDNRRQLRQRKALFEDKTRTQKLRHGSGDGQIVHRPVHRQLAYRAAGKKQGLHHKRVGTHSQPFARQLQHRRVAQIFESRIAESGQEKVFDQFVAQLATSAMAHHDGGIANQRQRAAPTREIRRASLCVLSHASTPIRRRPAPPLIKIARSCNRRRRHLRLKPSSLPADAAACILCRRPRTQRA